MVVERCGKRLGGVLVTLRNTPAPRSTRATSSPVVRSAGGATGTSYIHISKLPSQSSGLLNGVGAGVGDEVGVGVGEGVGVAVGVGVGVGDGSVQTGGACVFRLLPSKLPGFVESGVPGVELVAFEL